HLSGAVGHSAQIEAELSLNVMSPLVGDDDDPGEVSNLLLDQGAKLSRVVNRLIEYAVKGGLVLRIGATTRGHDRTIESDDAIRWVVDATRFGKARRPEFVDVGVKGIGKPDFTWNLSFVRSFIGVLLRQSVGCLGSIVAIEGDLIVQEFTGS